MNKYLSFLLVLCLTFLMAQTFPQNTRLIEPSQTKGDFVKAYLKHLNSNKDEVFYSVMSNSDNSDYFGQIINTGTRVFSRLRGDGMPVWTARFEGGINRYELNGGNKFLGDVDSNDNLYFLVNMKGATKFIDSDGSITNITFTTVNNIQKVLIKINKEGKLVWYRKIDSALGSAIKLDRNDDVFLVGTGGIRIDAYSLGYQYILKLDKNSGSVLFLKNFGNGAPGTTFEVTSMIPVFDDQNKLYLFVNPINYNSLPSYQVDGITIPANTTSYESLFLKFDTAGNLIAGKNFYANSTVYNSSFITDAVFDGSNFIVSGIFECDSTDTYYLGMDGIQFPKEYQDYTYSGLFAKITIDGGINWQKVIHCKSARKFYTNLQLDQNNDIYEALYFQGKVNYNNVEYTFNDTVGEKAIIKFDNSGNLKYLKTIDNYGDTYSGKNWQDYIVQLDLFGVDKYNLSAFTAQSNFLNYPLYNQNVPKNYIATFGNLNTKYLTPQSNYLELTNVGMTNNLDDANSFSFNLINNVNWIATSDQNWLTLSYAKLSQKSAPTNTISDSGDAKITLNAQTNNTGTTRTANVLIYGDQGVSSKTIMVTQTTVLGTNDAKTFVTTLYPNPTSDILNIKSEQKISRIEVYDISGKLLKSVDGKNKNVSVSSLNKGMYLIKLYTENGVVNSKFIKN